MYRIKITTVFTAGHQLNFKTGSEPYHIHDWLVETAVAGNQLDENGLLFDFTQLKKIVEDITRPFSDCALEDFDCFKGVNTSAENVAKYLFTSIKNHLPAGISLLYVEVTEAAGCKARYSEIPV